MPPRLAGFTRALVAALLLTVALAAAPAPAAEIEVETTNDELDGDDDCSLREAVEAANQNAAVSGCDAGDPGEDTIFVERVPGQVPSAHELDGDDDEDANVGGDLDISESVIIDGEPFISFGEVFKPEINGGDHDRAIDVLDGVDPVQVTLDEFLIRDGRASDQSGGAIRSVETDSSLLLTDTDVRSSRTNRDGGGIHARGAVTIERGRFFDNTARDGGAIESHGPLSLEGDPDPGATPEFEDNTAVDFGGAVSSYGPTESIGVAFTANSSEFGGAIANDTALLTIDGGSFSANEAALRGGAIESDGDVVVSDATLENQRASVGAGIATDADASATIDASSLKGNRAEVRGGAVSTGNASVSDTSFESNRAVTGGAIFTQQGGTASESEFLANAATGAETGATVTPGLGGAIQSSSGPLMVDHSTFDDNRAGLDVNRGDGVLHVSDGDLTMSTSTVSRNTTVGSVVSLDGGGLELENSTVADNRVVKGGAAIRVLSEGLSPSTVSHATIAGNVVTAGAGTATGGIEVDASLTLERSILAFNSVRSGRRRVRGSNCALPEAITSGGHNLETYNGCGFVPGAPDFDLTNTNPLLAPLAYNGGETNTMGLYDTSPAIDAVADCPPPPSDQRDVARPAGQCDIAAFEGSLGAPTEDCRGVAATIVGTRAADTIVGTAGPDVIVGLAGRDAILGAAGNDRICGDAGRDDLRGGSGRNRIFQ